MSDLVLSMIQSGYNLSVLNNNFDDIEKMINDSLLHRRDGHNFMEQPLDMNSNKVINVGAPTHDYDIARLWDVKNEPGRIGPVGPQGPLGPQGIQGPEGIQGIDGPIGMQGIQGVEGPQGALGATPNHEWNGKSLRLQQGDGTWGNYSDLEGPQGPIGVTGPQGPVGPTPNHEWLDKSLRLQQGDGTWGNYSDLEGPQGPIGITGPQGVIGLTPSSEWAGSRLRFIQGDGSWGFWSDLLGPEGPQGIVGPQGNLGPSPEHQWAGSKLRFMQGDGAWGNWEDVKGPDGPQGIVGPQGVIGVQGPLGPLGPQGIQGIKGDRGDKGDTGDQGQSFKVDAIGKFVDRVNFDLQPKGFGFLAYDVASTGATSKDDTINVFTGDGVTKTFTITFAEALVSAYIVSVGGAVQRPTSYEVSNYKLTFDTAPFNGAQVDVRLVSAMTGLGAIYFKQSSTKADWTPAIPFGKGPQGDKGIKGDRGDTGLQGPMGVIGLQGPQGIQGIKGSQGAVGLQGDRGPEGQKGLQGDKGITGSQGLVGPQGLRGPEGVKGVQGDMGIDGPQGKTGEQGMRGPEGQKGVQGDKGIDGSQGPTGLQGLRGPEGQKGVQGDKGIDGQQGPQGAPGVRGNQGFQGDRGPEGFQGIPGAVGPSGTQGNKGETGSPGIQGLPGDKGPTGDRGTRGSRAIYVATTGTVWNANIINSEIQRLGYWPPVDYDMGTLYNNRGKFAVTYRWFNGRWDNTPIELTENGTLKIMNGVDATELLPNSVSAPISTTMTNIVSTDNNATWTTNFSLSGETVTSLLLLDIDLFILVPNRFYNTGVDIETSMTQTLPNGTVSEVYKMTNHYVHNIVGHTVKVPNLSLNHGAKVTGSKGLVLKFKAMIPSGVTVPQILTTSVKSQQVSGILFKV